MIHHINITTYKSARCLHNQLKQVTNNIKWIVTNSTGLNAIIHINSKSPQYVHEKINLKRLLDA